MRSVLSISMLVTVVFLSALPANFANAESIGTAFAYQGRLIDSETAADGLYDFSFRLYEVPEGGDPVGESKIELIGVEVIDGYFTVELDFGETFNGERRWLEIGVRDSEVEGSESETLEPRQEVTPTPYALYAVSSGDAGKTYSGLAPVNVNNTANTIGLNAGTTTGDLMSWDGNNWVSTRPEDLALNNMQPFLCVNYIIALQGIYPSRNSAEPFIAEIILFGGNFAPRGWAFCDGQLLSISSNSALFSLLGTTYGGDGRNTFGLPDLRGRVPVHPGNGPDLSPRNLGQKGGKEIVD